MTEQGNEMDKYQNPCILPDSLNILQRMNWVRDKVSYVQKDAVVQGQYKAVRHDAVTASIRTFLIQAGIVTSQTLKSSTVVDSGSTTQKGVPIIRYEATYTIVFHNVDKIDDYLTVEVEAHALDMGDKAPGKCMSYAKKYAYLKEFDIETGEDEESRIEQKATADMQAEKDAFKAEKLNVALSAHMDTIQVIKEGIKDADPILDSAHQIDALQGNEDGLRQAVEAWNELTNDEKVSIWVAPSKGGPFSTDERYVMKCSMWAEIVKEMKE